MIIFPEIYAQNFRFLRKKGDGMMGKRNAFLLTAAVFLIAVSVCFFLTRVGSGENIAAARHADSAEIMRGGDDPDAEHIELLPDEKININTASADELSRLPGIGETLAQNIVSYRQENGFFNGIEEIMEVDGIGEERFDAIRLLIVTG